MANEYNIGLDLLVYVGATLVAGQRNCSYEVASEEIDLSSKTTGGWRKIVPGIKSWSAECEGLYVFNEVGFEALMTAMEQGDTVVLEFKDANSVGKSRRGDAMISSISVEADYEDSMTYSVSFVGAGPLNIVQPV